jgi:hypothetical protein
MTKTQKKVLAEVLRKALADTDKYSDEKPGPDGYAFCYGYLIGTITDTIYQLEK